MVGVARPSASPSRSAPPPVRRRQGRPRSQESHDAIQKATLDMLLASGFAAMSIEAVAARAGVSKTTIYRWWPSKASLAMEAFLSRIVPALPFTDTGDIREDFRRHLYTMVKVLHGPLGRVLAEVVAAMQRDEDLAKAFRNEYVVPRRVEPRRALEQAVERGQLPPATNPDLVMDAMYGAIYFALLVRNHAIDTHLVDELISQLLAGPSD